MFAKVVVCCHPTKNYGLKKVFFTHVSHVMEVKGVKGVKDECLANSFHFETPNELEDRTRLDGIVLTPQRAERAVTSLTSLTPPLKQASRAYESLSFYGSEGYESEQICAMRFIINLCRALGYNFLSNSFAVTEIMRIFASWMTDCGIGLQHII